MLEITKDTSQKFPLTSEDEKKPVSFAIPKITVSKAIEKSKDLLGFDANTDNEKPGLYESASLPKNRLSVGIMAAKLEEIEKQENQRRQQVSKVFFPLTLRALNADVSA